MGAFKTIHLAKGVELPLDMVTSTIAILAIKRAGKSFTARRIAEQMLGAGQQVCILDPKGDWWGIRSSADGKNPGYPVVIIGGERGDVPLEPDSGELVAKLVAEEQVNVLLDLSLLSKAALAKFVGVFLENLYRIKARDQFRTPMMLIIDEADAIAPQKTFDPNQNRMLGAANDIVRRGGQRGIGCMMITQRSAVLNKDVLSQCPILFALRTTGTHDIAAVMGWVTNNLPDIASEVKRSLPSLPTGEPWILSAEWPAERGIAMRAKILPIETFDSGATPRVGQVRVEPRTVADVDLGVLEKRMAETLERAKAEDPKALRQYIAELERAAKNAQPKVEYRDRPVLQDGELSELRSTVARLQDVVHTILAKLDLLIKYGASQIVEIEPKPVQLQEAAYDFVSRDAGHPPASDNDDSADARILRALAQLHPAIGTRKSVGVLSGVNPKKSTWRASMARLKRDGFINVVGDSLSLTKAGVVHCARMPAITPAERIASWKDRFGAATNKLFDVLIQAKTWVDKASLGAITGIDPNLSTWRAAMAPLRASGFLHEQNGQFGIDPEFFK